MNTLKGIQYCFPRTNLSRVQRPRKSNSRRRTTLWRLSSSDHGSSEFSSSSSSPDGDKQRQEFLAQIAMLQTQKVRLTEFLDERSEHLTQFAEDANAEFDAIGENALKELDDAGARIMEKLESRMQAFEEKAEMNMQEIEENEKVLEEFKEQIVKDRNEGLFFKNLGERTPQRPAASVQMAEEKAGSKTRRNIYLALMSLLILAIGNAVFAAGSDVEWRKVAALGLILVGLLAQFSYERSISSSTAADETNEEED